MAWSPTLNGLFSQYKSNILTSPLLFRYDSSKSVFLKTDWSATGMGFIVMQLDNSPESLESFQHLSKTGEWHFDFDLQRARLYPVTFGSCSNQKFKEHYHSFVDEITCCRIQYLCPTWFLSIHTLSSSSVGANGSCYHSLLYLLSHLLSSDSPIRVFSIQSFPSPPIWLFTIFNTPSFSLFKSWAIPSSPRIESYCNQFLRPDNNETYFSYHQYHHWTIIPCSWTTSHL